MKRSELIDQLGQVQFNIEQMEKRINQEPSFYYVESGHMERWNHLIEVRKKALAYWKRRFNRILLQLGYKL